ncbi:MAG: bifunctional phosphoribosylaminoimidazolecarboxamide formyltransferase/IMP cyclohydrolase, partial [Bacteroidales bacterium]|nr:bifunctional phosphoribosylaminoimidazolecarboxamide formyltransferase/IMP cyclohydrolase [Bacteroidales bacterium]
VTEVSAYTASPEILGGRVKTLHPAIHGGILSQDRPDDRAELAGLGWDNIDLVVVNLYPFESTIARPDAAYADAIENIDIGGVTLIRAAAKNHARVTLLCDPGDYPAVLQYLEKGAVPADVRKKLAVKGFGVTAAYDQAIHAYLSGSQGERLQIYPILPLRYGENPHQQAMLYGYTPDQAPLGGKVLQGKELSYNNLLDLDAAWRAVTSFSDPGVVIVKHLSPCGIATSDRLADAYLAALASDPVSAYGGVVACNLPLDMETAMQIKKLFVECIICPGFPHDVREILAEKKNLRLLEMPGLKIHPPYEYRSVNGGILRQTIDRGDPSGVEWQVVSKREPTQEEWLSLKFDASYTIKKNTTDFKGQVRIRKDSLIWISITPALGIEYLRMVITNDSVKYVNRFNKEYFVGDYALVSRFLQINIDFDILQSLIIGNDFQFYETNSFRASIDQPNYKLSTTGRRKIRKDAEDASSDPIVLLQNIWLDPGSFKITKVDVKEYMKDNRKLSATYSDFEPMETQFYPSELHFDIMAEDIIKIRINFSKVTLNEPMAFPFSIPENYKRIQ